MQPSTALAILLPISLTIFGLFGKFSLDMRRDHNYRASWAWGSWAILPGFLSALYLAAGMPIEMRNITLGSLGAALGACVAIWLGYVIAGNQAVATPTLGNTNTMPPSATTAIQQHNQGPGQQFNAPGGNIYVNPTPQQVPDSGTILQAGAVVGKAFGARRSPNDATRFEFVEITNCDQLNTGSPFTYSGIRMLFVSEKESIMMLVGRQKDSPIRFGVTARVME